jgi:hypothetical protein
MKGVSANISKLQSSERLARRYNISQPNERMNLTLMSFEPSRLAEKVCDTIFFITGM